MARLILEGEWHGYRSSQDRVVHREMIGKQRADRLAASAGALRTIQFTDGTTLHVSVRPVQRREVIVERRAYSDLIREAEAMGRPFVRVADLPESEDAA